MPPASAISDRDRVLAATDILSVVGEVVALRPKGREHLGLCPFHDDSSPSLAVVTHKGTGFYKCFSCGAAGNAIDFVINYHRMEFPDALRFLAERARIELTPYRPEARPRRDGEPTRDEILRANQLAERFFRRVYADAEAGAKARAEVARRGFDAETVDAFGLGAAPARGDALVDGVEQAIRKVGTDYPPFDAFVAAGVIRQGRGGLVDLLRDRLVFPIRDDLGRPIAFGGRKLDPEQEPKYLNSPESPVFHKSRALYGIDRAKRAIVASSCAIVTEGYTDVIACHRGGFQNAVATLGTAFTREHARALRRLSERVILLFDGDEAGQKAADRALDVLLPVYLAESVDLRICVLPDGLDPDDLLRQEGGPERFRTALDRAVDALPFMASRIRRRIAGRGLSGRQQEIEQAVAKLVDAGLNGMNALRRQLVMNTLSDLFGLAAPDLDRLARGMMPRPGPQTPERGLERGPASTIEPKEPVDLGAGDGENGVAPLDPASAARRRARREAERRLLGLLCCEPALVSLAVPVSECGMLPLSEAVSPKEFITPGHSAVFAAIRDAAEAGRAIGFDGLLGELASAELKSLASDLYGFGFELYRDVTSASAGVIEPRSIADEIAASWSDLEQLERRHRFQDSRHRGGRSQPDQATRAERPFDPDDESGSGSDADSDVARGGGDPEDSGASPVGTGAADAAPTEQDRALERLARLRERGHDVTAARGFFRRRPDAARDQA